MVVCLLALAPRLTHAAIQKRSSSGAVTKAVTTAAGEILTWNRSPSEPNIDGYRIYYGGASGQYAQHLDVAITNTATIPSPAAGTSLYCVVVAFKSAVESPPSNEVQTTASAPAPTPTPPPSPSPSPLPSATPSPTPIVVVTPIPSPTPTPSSTPSSTPTPTPAPTPIATPVPSPSVIPQPTAAVSPSPTPNGWGRRRRRLQRLGRLVPDPAGPPGEVPQGAAAALPPEPSDPPTANGPIPLSAPAPGETKNRPVAAPAAANPTK